MDEVRREQIKLRAAYYNGVAVAIVAVGALGVPFSLLRQQPTVMMALSSFGFLFLMMILSIFVRELAAGCLRTLKEG